MGKTAIILGASGLTGSILLNKLLKDERYNTIKLFSRKKIDYGIPVAAATLAKENKITTFLVVSALGANVKSAIFYNKTKGEMEFEVLQQNITNTYILQPSIISGNRKETRIGEKIGLILFKLFQPLFFEKLKKYSITKANDIALSMISLANSTATAVQIITSDKRNFKKL
ncbi:MAG: nucleoside-diphosphate sugar epimerase [Lutibacter sp.]|uniref:nucleoside-diphosphate sugar epimerase n=1 Tax=Lutibacter sp. TaxID=1925666 RepID=UPI003859339B